MVDHRTYQKYNREWFIEKKNVDYGKTVNRVNIGIYQNGWKKCFPESIRSSRVKYCGILF